MTTTAAPQQDTTRFWADGLDMDLPKILPELRDRIGGVGDKPLWTYGSLSRDGLFSHPSVWNCYIGTEAFFWPVDPELPRENGWVSINGRVTDEPLCRLTVWEAIRDCWSHHYTLRLNGHEVLRSSMRFYNSHFYPLMADLRGWNSLSGSRRMALLSAVEGWAAQGARNIDVVIRVALGGQA